LQQWRDVYNQFVRQHLSATAMVSEQFSAQQLEEHLWAAVEQRISQLGTAIRNQQTTIGDQQTTIGDQQTTIGDQQTTIGDLQATNTYLTLVNMDLDSAWQQQQRNNIQISNRLGETRAEVRELRAEVRELRGEIVRLNRQLQVNFLIKQ
jgi:chromosome segregation ATPase